MRLTLAGATLGGVLALAVPPPAGGQVPPDLGGYAVLGVEGVVLRRLTRVQSGAVGSIAGSVSLGQGARVSGAVAADAVHLARETSVGHLFCRLVVGALVGGGVAGGATVAGSRVPGCATFPIPLVDPALLPVVPVTPGVTDLRVPRRSGTAPIAPGSYADVIVGRGALLQLAGGPYTARSITVGRAGRIVCLEECRIGVLKGVVLRRQAQLGTRTGLPPGRARVDISADGTAFRSRPGSVVAATIYAPAGDVLLGARGSYRGAYVGRSVVVATDARLRLASAL